MEEFKFIQPFLQRATELKTREPIISYYCSFYAAKLAIESPVKTKESQVFLMGLLDDLEKEKALLKENEAIHSDVVGYAHVHAFANKIFLNADNEDRAGLASKKTAKTFLAASIFLELLKVFGDMDPEILEKIKYAKFKAADIIKALKEGRAPTAGPPGGEPEDFSNAFTTAPTETQMNPSGQDVDAPIPGMDASLGYEFAPATAPPPSWDASLSKFEDLSVSDPHAPAAFSPMSPSTQGHAALTKTQEGSSQGFPKDPSPSASLPPLDYKIVGQAQKYAKFAISALQYDDVKTAMENFRKAIALLGPYET